MSAEEQAKKQNYSEVEEVEEKNVLGTARQAEGAASGDTERAKPKPRVAEDDALARALGGIPTGPDPVVSAPDYGLKEVRETYQIHPPAKANLSTPPFFFFSFQILGCFNFYYWAI